MPLTAIRKGQQPLVGSIAEFKYKSRFYEAEVLRASSKYVYLTLFLPWLHQLVFVQGRSFYLYSPSICSKVTDKIYLRSAINRPTWS